MKKLFYTLSLCFLLAMGCNLSCVNADDANVWNIYAKFCSGEELLPSLSLVADSDTEYEICINFINSNNSEVSLDYSFIDGTVTNDEYQNKACTTNDMSNFWQFVRQDNTSVVIPAHGSVEQKAYITFPSWVSWISNGCLVYSLSKGDTSNNEVESDWSMFEIQLRKASFIDVLVWGEINRNLTLSKKLFRSFNRKTDVLTLSAPIINNWNINESAYVEWTVKNILGYKNSFTMNDPKIVRSNSELVINADAENIPWYRMFYHLEWNIISEGSLEFDTSLLSEDVAQQNVLPFSFTIFIFPRALLFIILWIIVLTRLIRYLSKHLTFKK